MSNSRTRFRVKILGLFIIICFLTLKYYDHITGLDIDISSTQTVDSVGCKGGSCNKQTTKKINNLTVVTGANANHFCELQSWLYYMYGTFRKLPKDIRPKILVYDLGIANYQKKILSVLEKKGYFDGLIEFNFDKYPKFWDIDVNAGEYAWKPGIIKEVSVKYPGIIVWLDTGTFISKRFLSKLDIILNKYNGFISPKSSGKLLTWTHPGVFKYFNQDINKYKHKNYHNCNGAGVIFDTEKTQYLIDQWYECALVKECIAPKGSSRENHRQDQAILTYLVINDHRDCKEERSFFGMKTHMDDYCQQIVYNYDKLHGEFFWPTKEDLEEINHLKVAYNESYVYDIWSEGALDNMLAFFEKQKNVTV